jgi:hypothetical protein
LTAPADPEIVGGTLVSALATTSCRRLSIWPQDRYEAAMAELRSTRDNQARLVAILIGILAAAAMRLLPHPPNFSPIAAMALFSGAYLPKRALSFAAPFGALLLSDAVLGGFYPGIGFVYFSFALVVLIGWAIASRKTVLTIGAAALASSVLFFVLTNFGTWLFSGFYPRTWEGLIACYLAAIPFFQNTLAGDLVFTALLFGGFALLERAVPAIRQRQLVAS